MEKIGKKLVSVIILSAIVILSLCGCASRQKEFIKSSEIGVISRESGSGTRDSFTTLLGIQNKTQQGLILDKTTPYAIVTDKTAVMMTTVSNDLYAIGYISLGSLNQTVKALKIDGVEASIENIRSGKYKISRSFNIITNSSLTPQAEDFISFIMSRQGQETVNRTGYVPIGSDYLYKSSGVQGRVVVSGSSSLVPVMERLKEEFERLNRDIKIEIQQSDSSTGIRNVIEAACDIGLSSRELKESEEGVRIKCIAKDGIAVIVNNRNPILDLSSRETAKIFTGEYTRWEEVY